MSIISSLVFSSHGGLQSKAHFSHVHATFGLGIEQCSNRRRNLVPEESGPKFAWHTYQKSAPEKWSRFMAPVSEACVMGLRNKLQLCTARWPLRHAALLNKYLRYST